MVKTKTEKLITATEEDFRIKYYHELDDLANWMEANRWINELAPEFVNYYDFSKYNVLCTVTEEAQMAGFDIEELRDMIKKDAPIRTIEATVALALKEFYETTTGKDFGLGDTEDVKKFLDYNVKKEYLSSLAENNIDFTSKPQIDSSEELLNQEVPKDYTQKQRKAITTVCDNIENEANKYAEKYGPEYKEVFYTTAMNKIADVIAFSSDNTADQMIGLGKCICSFLTDKQPDDLENLDTSAQIDSFCNIIKEHEFPKAFYDFLIDERYTIDKEHDYDEKIHSIIGRTNFYANTLWEKVKDRFSLYALNMCLENAETKSIWDGLRTTCCTLGLSSKKRLDSICQNASKFLRDDKGKIKPTDLYEVINFFTEKIPPKEAFGYVRRINDIPGFEYPLELATKVTSEFYKAGFPDAFTNILVGDKLSYIEATELLAARANGLSFYEIDKCLYVSFRGLRPSVTGLCEARLILQEELGLEQDKENSSVFDSLDEKKNIVKNREEQNPNHDSQGKDKSEPEIK